MAVGPGGPDWGGLLKWSLGHCDGTAPAREVSQEEREWFQNMVRDTYVDEVQVMKQIGDFLVKESEEGVEEEEMVQTKEELLEELQDIVENVDRARDLKCIGGLPILLSLMTSQHAGLRWRSAEVLAACVQNHPEVQQWALEGGCIPPLVQLLDDENSTCVVKALFALTSLTRNFPAGSNALLDNGLQKVCSVACPGHSTHSSDPKVATKALRLLAALAVTAPNCQLIHDCHGGGSGSGSSSSRVMESILTAASSQDDQLRESAMALLLLIISHLPSALNQGELLQSFKAVLGERKEALKKLMFEDRQCCLEEEDTCDALLERLEALSAAGGSGSGPSGAGASSSSAEAAAAAPLLLTQ